MSTSESLEAQSRSQVSFWVKNVIMRCVVEEMQGRLCALWNEVVDKLLFITFHRHDVDANTQGLRQSQDVHVITLHRHGLYFLKEEPKK